MQSTDLPAFPPFPCVSRYVPVGPVQEAVERVRRAIDSREAVSLVIGPPGTGKSLICNLLANLHPQSHEVVIVGETPIEDRQTLLRHLLHQLGAEIDQIPEGDLHLALKHFITEECDAPDGLLLIVDEAQKLSVEAIEAVRMVTNITRDGEPRIFAVLCGGVKLDETLVDVSLEALVQRIATRCYLHPLNGEQTRKYIVDTIHACGADAERTITDEAISAIHHACSGVPRLINQLISQAIDVAADQDESLISDSIVDQAWAALQQLPSPIIEEPKIAGKGSDIEFGELNDPIDFGDWNPGSDRTEPYFAEVANQVADEDEPLCSTEDEIAVDCSTASWVEESDGEYDTPEYEDAGQPATTPERLFGQFEHEEEIIVGNGVMPPASMETKSDKPDLETILQQEIVGVSSAVSDATRNESQIEVEQTVEVAEQVELDMEISSGEREADPGVDFDSVIPFSAGDLTGNMDDQDILIIEDEIQMHAPEPKVEPSARDQAVSVDFHSMLGKMRGTR